MIQTSKDEKGQKSVHDTLVAISNKVLTCTYQIFFLCSTSAPHPPAAYKTNFIDLVFPERTPTIKLLRRFVNVNKIAHRNKASETLFPPTLRHNACEVMCFNSISNFLVSIFIVFFINPRFRSFSLSGTPAGVIETFLIDFSCFNLFATDGDAIDKIYSFFMGKST